MSGLSTLVLLLTIRKSVIAINTSDGSRLGDNLIKSQQVDFLSLAPVEAEAAGKYQEHLPLIR